MKTLAILWTIRASLLTQPGIGGGREVREARAFEVLLLMTRPGVGPITGLAYVLVIGAADRFPCGKQVGSYVGLIPCGDSVPAGNGWDISANRAIHFCASCWWKQHRQPLALQTFIFSSGIRADRRRLHVALRQQNRNTSNHISCRRHYDHFSFRRRARSINGCCYLQLRSARLSGDHGSSR